MKPIPVHKFAPVLPAHNAALYELYQACIMRIGEESEDTRQTQWATRITPSHDLVKNDDRVALEIMRQLQPSWRKTIGRSRRLRAARRNSEGGGM